MDLATSRPVPPPSPGFGLVAVATAIAATLVSCGAQPVPTVEPSPALVCPTGKADCDGDRSNGCEAALSQPTSCGRCGATCAAGESCLDGECRRAHRLQASATTCAIRAGAVHCWGPLPGPPDEFEDGRETTLPRRLEGITDAVSLRFNASMSSPVCATLREGKVVCWPETPKALGSLPHVRDAASYGDNVCAVTASGELFCGLNEAQRVPKIGDATAVVASDDGFFAVRRDGHIAQISHELGNESEGAARVELSHVGGVSDAVDVAAAYHALCVLRRSGRVACSDVAWGAPSPPPASERPLVEVPGLADAVAIDVGCAVRATGEIVTWDAPGSTPKPVAGVKDAKAVACGLGSNCYERADGAVLCWGSRRSGRLGDGAEITRSAPVVAEGIGDATAVVVDDLGSCALRRDGTVWCWGGRSSLARGIPPEPVPKVDGIRTITESARRACVAGPGRPVTCFDAHLPADRIATFEGLGEIVKAQTGWFFGGIALRASGEAVLFDTRAREGTHRPRPFVVPGVKDAVDVAHAGHDACVLRKGGSVLCADMRDVFPDDKEGPAVTPAFVAVSGVRDAMQLTAGIEVCALLRSGETTCFGWVQDEPKAGAKGSNPKKKPKAPTRRYVAKPSRFEKMTGIQRFDEAGLGGCVVTAKREVICQSQMGPALRGTGLAEPPAGDLPVRDVTDAVDVAMGSTHACAVLRSGRVMCWGSNDGDALGGGPSPVSLVPVEVKLDASR